MRALRTIEHWNALLDNSYSGPVVIFKHSNTCPGSTEAFEEVKKFEEEGGEKTPVYLVVVQVARDISDRIEKDVGIKHESPQVIILKDGKSVYDADHSAISAKKIAQNIT